MPEYMLNNMFNWEEWVDNDIKKNHNMITETTDATTKQEIYKGSLTRVNDALNKVKMKNAEIKKSNQGKTLYDSIVPISTGVLERYKQILEGYLSITSGGGKRRRKTKRRKSSKKSKRRKSSKRKSSKRKRSKRKSRRRR